MFRKKVAEKIETRVLCPVNVFRKYNGFRRNETKVIFMMCCFITREMLPVINVILLSVLARASRLFYVIYKITSEISTHRLKI